MASIKNIASRYIDEFRCGVPWVALWKTGRSWNAEAFYGADYDERTGAVTVDEDDDLKRMQEILEEDPNAVMLSGYYCNCGGNEETMTVSSLADALVWQYRECGNHLAEFVESAQHQREGQPAEQTAEPEAQTEDGTIRVLRKQPGEGWEEIRIPNTRDALELQVGGGIQCCPFGEDFVLICRKDGRQQGLPRNGFMDFCGTILAAGIPQSSAGKHQQ